MDILFKRDGINDDEETRNTSQTLTVLLGVVLGVASVIVSCFLYVLLNHEKKASAIMVSLKAARHDR